MDLSRSGRRPSIAMRGGSVELTASLAHVPGCRERSPQPVNRAVHTRAGNAQSPACLDRGTLCQRKAYGPVKRGYVGQHPCDVGAEIHLPETITYGDLLLVQAFIPRTAPI